MSLTNPIISDLIVDGYRRDRLATVETDRRAQRSPNPGRVSLAMIGQGMAVARALLREGVVRKGQPLATAGERTLSPSAAVAGTLSDGGCRGGC